MKPAPIEELLRGEAFGYVPARHDQPLMERIWKLGQAVRNASRSYATKVSVRTAFCAAIQAPAAGLTARQKDEERRKEILPRPHQNISSASVGSGTTPGGSTVITISVVWFQVLLPTVRVAA